MNCQGYIANDTSPRVDPSPLVYSKGENATTYFNLFVFAKDCVCKIPRLYKIVLSLFYLEIIYHHFYLIPIISSKDLTASPRLWRNSTFKMKLSLIGAVVLATGAIAGMGEYIFYYIYRYYVQDLTGWILEQRPEWLHMLEQEMCWQMWTKEWRKRRRHHWQNNQARRQMVLYERWQRQLWRFPAKVWSNPGMRRTSW